MQQSLRAPHRSAADEFSGGETAAERVACVLRSEGVKTLSPGEVELVQRSWRSVHLVGDTAAEMFYGKLFNLAPEVRSLFKSDLRDQGRNLTAMISVAVHSLGRPEKILVAVRQLGARHAAYGVRERHYAVVGAALLWMLEQVLGEGWTAQVAAAWQAAYAMLAAAMQEGACEFSP
jgi:hemoglobin-like flavoprotein